MTLPEFDDLLAEISERAFSSGWRSGIEFEAWLIATGAKEPVLGRTTVTVLELERLRTHLAEASTWISFDLERDEPVLRSMHEWLPACDRYRKDPASVVRIWSVNLHSRSGGNVL